MAHLRCLFATAILIIAAGSAGAEEPRGIAVVGVGEAKAKANVAEIVASVRGLAEKGADALAKYRKAKADVLRAMIGLKLEALSVSGMGLKIESRTPSRQMAVMMGGGGGAAADKVKTKILVSEQIRLSLSGIDKMTTQALSEMLIKVIDAGVKAGMQLGSGQPENVFTMQRGQQLQLVSFKLSNRQALRELAYKAAMAQARQRAERLAALGGVKLGSVRSLRDASVGTPNQDTRSMMQMLYGMGQQKPAKPGTSALLTDVTIKVELSVVYAIQQ